MEPKRISLALLPTPLSRLERTSKLWGVDVWVKRDDLTGAVETGNKVRKLEFVMAEALEQGADMVITCGGEQSNHCRATAAVARKLGLDVVLMLRRTGEGPTGNWLLDMILGAEFVWVTPEEYKQRDELMAQLADEYRKRGRKPYIIPEGASNPLGAMGYFHAAHEVYAQFNAENFYPDFIVIGSGSGGTYAGLWTGFKNVGFDVKIVGISAGPDTKELKEHIKDVALGIKSKYFAELELNAEEILLFDDYWQPGYGVITYEHVRFICDFAAREGIILDSTYTSKAFMAAEDLIKKGFIPKGSRVLLWHTGGVFGLFSKGQLFREHYFSGERTK